ncbi:hypothetical protein BIKONL_002711 [Pseudomonas putida]
MKDIVSSLLVIQCHTNLLKLLTQNWIVDPDFPIRSNLASSHECVIKNKGIEQLFSIK